MSTIDDIRGLKVNIVCMQEAPRLYRVIHKSVKHVRKLADATVE